jgi:hypothetical protein
MMKRPRRSSLGLALLGCVAIVIIAIVAGCGKAGPKLAPVSGTITLDGAPLTDAVVSFVSASGYVSSAPLDANGHFKLTTQYGPGLPLGDYLVSVLPQNPAGNGATMEAAMKSNRPSPRSRIPERYQYPNRSGLNATVQDGPAEFTFRLTTVK